MKLDPPKFVALVDGIFAESMLSLGFTPAGEDPHDDWHCSRRFRAGERYVEISASCHPRDGVPECRIVLGEGSNEWPECDWNSIALWRLRGQGGNYPFHSTNEIAEVLVRMRDDLLQYATDFLTGDTDRFLEQRAAQNRDREPYKVYSPQSDGSYRMAYDPESQELKNRFSQTKKA